MGRLRPEVQPLTPLYTIFDPTGIPFVYLFIDERYPFHTPSLTSNQSLNKTKRMKGYFLFTELTQVLKYQLLHHLGT